MKQVSKLLIVLEKERLVGSRIGFYDTLTIEVNLITAHALLWYRWQGVPNSCGSSSCQACKLTLLLKLTSAIVTHV